MGRTCCLAGLNAGAVPLFSAVLSAVGETGLATIARLDVAALSQLRPDVLVCDVDGIVPDPLELLRQLRFVLPDSLIAVYTGMLKPHWGRACHLAGANGVLSKLASERKLAAGLRAALASGCYTDPLFAA